MISYTSLLTSLPRRQDKLACLWFFTCSCQRYFQRPSQNIFQKIFFHASLDISPSQNIFQKYFLTLLLIYQVCGPYRAGKLYEQRCLSCLSQGRTSSSWTHSSREREVEVEIRQNCRLSLIIGKYFGRIDRYCICQPIYLQIMSAV